MSTLAEIQEAITKLPDDEKTALSVWFHSQAAPGMTAEDEQRLLRSLDEAIRDVDAGKGVPIDDARRMVAPIFQHRIIPNFAAQSASVTADDITRKIIEAVPKDEKLK